MKDLKVFCIDWESVKYPFLGFFEPLFSQTAKYCLILLKLWPEVVSDKKSVFEKSFKILNFSLNGRHPKFTVLFHFGAWCTAGKPKILLKTKNVAKTISLGISNSISLGSQKNHRILVKSNKKYFCGRKLGLNCPQWPHQRVIRNSHSLYNRNIPLNVLDAKFQFLWICCSGVYLEEAPRFFGLGADVSILVCFGQ